MDGKASSRGVLQAVSAGGPTAAFPGCTGLLNDEEGEEPCEVAERTVEAMTERDCEAAVERLPAAYLVEASVSDVLAEFERDDSGDGVELHKANCVCEESIDSDAIAWLDDLDAGPSAIKAHRIDVSADVAGEPDDGNASFHALEIDGEWYVGEVGSR